MGGDGDAGGAIGMHDDGVGEERAKPEDCCCCGEMTDDDVP